MVLRSSVMLALLLCAMASCKGPEPRHIAASDGGGGSGGGGGTGGSVDCVDCTIGCGSEGCLQAVDLAAGAAHTCAVLSDGTARCWGYNKRDILFLDMVAEPAEPGSFTPTPTPVEGLADAVDAQAGMSNTCARTMADTLVCWGWNGTGQLGAGDLADSETPREVMLGGTLDVYAIGLGHACAAITTGELLCWGTNFDGQLGLGTADSTPVPTPTEITSPGFAAAALTAGSSHTCARSFISDAFCWGGSDSGEVGNGDTQDVPTPTPVLDELAAQIATGGAFTCAVDSEKAVRCWGSNGSGELGTGASGNYELSPVDATALTAGLEPDRLVLGDTHGCLLDNEVLACWGNNENGQTADTTGAPTLTPREVALPGGVTDVALGYAHTCAIVAGDVYCWGVNRHGQLGSGDTNASTDPVRVSW